MLVVTEVSIRRTGAESQYPRRTRMLTYGVSRLEKKKVEHLWNLAMSNAKEVQWVQAVQEGVATDRCRMDGRGGGTCAVRAQRKGLLWFEVVQLYSPSFLGCKRGPGVAIWKVSGAAALRKEKGSS